MNLAEHRTVKDAALVARMRGECNGTRTKPLDVDILTTARLGKGGIARMMDAVAAGLLEAPQQEIRATFIETQGLSRLLWPLAFAKSLGRFILLRSTLRCDVLHINLASKGSTYRKLVFSILATLTRTPYVIHLHGGGYREFWASNSGAMGSLIAWMFRNASRIIVLGASWRELIVTRVPDVAGRVIVLPNAAPKPRDHPVRGIGVAEPPCILFLGKLCTDKGVPQLVDALAMLPPEARWTAVIAGDGDVDETRAAIAGKGLGGRVKVPGWMGPEDVEKLWEAADIFVLPSFVENFPLSIVEAFSHGVPVISTPVGSVPEILEDGRTGVLVPTGDSRALAEAMDELLHCPAKRREMATAAALEFDERFELGIYIARLAAIWRECARSSRSSPTLRMLSAGPSKRCRRIRQLCRRIFPLRLL